MEGFKIGDVVINEELGRGCVIWYDAYDADFLLVQWDNSYYNIHSGRGYAIDDDSYVVTNTGSWCHKSDLKLDKETKVLNMLREWKNSR